MSSPLRWWALFGFIFFARRYCSPSPYPASRSARIFRPAVTATPESLNPRRRVLQTKVAAVAPDGDSFRDDWRQKILLQNNPRTQALPLRQFLPPLAQKSSRN
jgi:hypothetical protein